MSDKKKSLSFGFFLWILMVILFFVGKTLADVFDGAVIMPNYRAGNLNKVCTAIVFGLANVFFCLPAFGIGYLIYRRRKDSLTTKETQA